MGKCVVIGLQSTGEARTMEALEREEELTDFVSTAKGVLQSLVEKHFPAPGKKFKFLNFTSFSPVFLLINFTSFVLYQDVKHFFFFIDREKINRILGIGKPKTILDELGIKYEKNGGSRSSSSPSRPSRQAAATSLLAMDTLNGNLTEHFYFFNEILN